MSLSAASCLHYFSSRYGHIPVVGGKPVHTRASTARLIDIASQQIVEVPAATPRDTHLVTIDGEERAGLLLEMAQTNKITADLDSFTLTNVTRTAGQIDPAGGTGAYLLETTASAGFSYFSSAGLFTVDGTKSAAVCLRDGTATTTKFGIYDSTAVAWRHRVNVNWSAAGVPTLSTDLGAGSLYPVIALGAGWYLLQIGVDGVVGANTDRFSLYPAGGGSGEVYAYNPQAEDGAFATSIIRPNTTRAADSFYWDYLPVPQAMMVYCRFVEAGSILNTNSAVFQITGATNAVPLLRIYRTSAGYFSKHGNGTTTVDTTALASPSIGDTVEICLILFADGSIQLIQSINGGAVTSTAVTGVLTLNAAWAGTRLWLNCLDATTYIGANRFAEVKAVKYADVVATTAQGRMDELRTMELGPNRELLASGS